MRLSAELRELGAGATAEKWPQAPCVSLGLARRVGNGPKLMHGARWLVAFYASADSASATLGYVVRYSLTPAMLNIV